MKQKMKIQVHKKKILCNHIFNLENNDGIVFEKEFNFLNDLKLG